MTIATRVIKDPVLRHAIFKAVQLETICIGIVQFYHLLAYE